MENEIEITSLTEAVEIGLKFNHNWWRGQPRKFGTLIPKIFRNDFYNEIHKEFDPKKEFEII